MRVLLTPDGAERLQDELARLKKQDRPAVIQAIAEARAHGDLSENAEYHAAREQQGFIEGRIAELDSKLSVAEVTQTQQRAGHRRRSAAVDPAAAGSGLAGQGLGGGEPEAYLLLPPSPLES